MHFADQSLIGRRLVVENMPNRVEMGQAQTLHEIYHMLYAFGVEVVEYRETAGSRYLSRNFLMVFATTEQAQNARSRYNMHILSSGHKIHISLASIGRSVLGQWKTWRVSSFVF
jgi:hypothetical protein